MAMAPDPTLSRLLVESLLEVMQACKLSSRPPPKLSAALAWVASLGPAEFRDVFTSDDREWASMAAEMASECRRTALGDGNLYVLDPPYSFSRRPRSRRTPWGDELHNFGPSPAEIDAGRTLQRAVGVAAMHPSLVTLTESNASEGNSELLRCCNVLSGGRFLSEAPESAGAPWFTERAYSTFGHVIANKLDCLAWARWQSAVRPDDVHESTARGSAGGRQRPWQPPLASHGASAVRQLEVDASGFMDSLPPLRRAEVVRHCLAVAARRVALPPGTPSPPGSSFGPLRERLESLAALCDQGPHPHPSAQSSAQPSAQLSARLTGGALSLLVVPVGWPSLAPFRRAAALALDECRAARAAEELLAIEGRGGPLQGPKARAKKKKAKARARKAKQQQRGKPDTARADGSSGSPDASDEDVSVSALGRVPRAPRAPLSRAELRARLLCLSLVCDVVDESLAKVSTAQRSADNVDDRKQKVAPRVVSGDAWSGGDGEVWTNQRGEGSPIWGRIGGGSLGMAQVSNGGADVYSSLFGSHNFFPFPFSDDMAALSDCGDEGDDDQGEEENDDADDGHNHALPGPPAVEPMAEPTEPRVANTESEVTRSPVLKPPPRSVPAHWVEAPAPCYTPQHPATKAIKASDPKAEGEKKRGSSARRSLKPARSSSAGNTLTPHRSPAAASHSTSLYSSSASASFDCKSGTRSPMIPATRPGSAPAPPPRLNHALSYGGSKSFRGDERADRPIRDPDPPAAPTLAAGGHVAPSRGWDARSLGLGRRRGRAISDGGERVTASTPQADTAHRQQPIVVSNRDRRWETVTTTTGSSASVHSDYSRDGNRSADCSEKAEVAAGEDTEEGRQSFDAGCTISLDDLSTQASFDNDYHGIAHADNDGHDEMHDAMDDMDDNDARSSDEDQGQGRTARRLFESRRTCSRLGEENAVLKDVALRLGAEVSKLRNVIASQQGMAHNNAQRTAFCSVPFLQPGAGSTLHSMHPSVHPTGLATHFETRFSDRQEVMSDDGSGMVYPAPLRLGAHSRRFKKANQTVKSPALASVSVPPPIPEAKPAESVLPVRSAGGGIGGGGIGGGGIGGIGGGGRCAVLSGTDLGWGRTSNATPFSSLPPSLLSSLSGSFGSKLSGDIERFVDAVDALEREGRSAKLAAFTACRREVMSLWPRAQVHMYGSFVTQLSLPTSDLDLVISLPKVRSLAPAMAPGDLEGRNAIKESWQQNLSRTLRSCNWVEPSSVKIISRTAVPVMKLCTTNSGEVFERASEVTHRRPSMCTAAAAAARVRGDGRLPLPTHRAVSLDVSFEGAAHKGVASCEYVRSRLEQLPAIRPLVLVLKQGLCDRSLSESYNGGLSSYALFIMVTRYVEEANPNADVGSLLLGFLDFYGNCFDPRTCGVSLRRRCYFNRSSDTSFFPPQFDPLYLEDPLNEGNNAGRNCFRIYLIQRIWSDGLRAVTAAMDRDPPVGTPVGSADATAGSLLDAITLPRGATRL